eukprot:1627294-Rhodomonas_salina.4
MWSESGATFANVPVRICRAQTEWGWSAWRVWWLVNHGDLPIACWQWFSGGWVVVHRTGLRSSPRGHRRSSWPVAVSQCGQTLSLFFTFGFGLGWFWFPKPGSAHISCSRDGCPHACCKDHVTLGWFETQLLEEVSALVHKDSPVNSENQLDSLEGLSPLRTACSAARYWRRFRQRTGSLAAGAVQLGAAAIQAMPSCSDTVQNFWELYFGVLQAFISQYLW